MYVDESTFETMSPHSANSRSFSMLVHLQMAFDRVATHSRANAFDHSATSIGCLLTEDA